MTNILCSLIAVLCMTTAFACPKYKVLDLGTLDKEVSVATSINDKGEVCGLFKPKDQSPAQLFLWSECTGIICPGVMINGFPGGYRIGNEVEPLIINKMGQVVGSCLLNPQNNNMLCMWDPKVGLKNLHSQLDRNGSIRDFNDLGDIVYFKSGSTYVYNINNNQLQNLGTLFNDWGIHINNKSELFGTALSSTGYSVARFHSIGEKRTYDINDKLKSNFYGKSINDCGQCAIHWQAPNGQGACTWSAETGTRPITFSLVGEFLKKINNKRQMITNHPYFIYDGCNWINLYEELKLANDPSTPFESIEAIHDINNKGQMVGTGIIHGKSHAVLITPIKCDCCK